MRTNNALHSIILAVMGIFLVISAQAQRAVTAIPALVNGFIIAVTVTDGGSGYKTPPTVRISGGGGSGAIPHVTGQMTLQDSIVNAWSFAH